MNTVELTQFSLKSALDILGAVTGDLTQEQADWVPEGVANPIGATYWHIISSVDQAVYGWGMGQAPLGETAGWQEKVLLTAAPDWGAEDIVAKMRALRVDLAAMHGYAQAVGEAAQGWLAILAPEDLERKIETPLGEQSLDQMLATFVMWHINAHCGEIAALKGCQGAKGYPF
jgi:hypothetical protein